MASTEIKTSIAASARAESTCAGSFEAKTTHPILVGVLLVPTGPVWTINDLAGGLLNARPRTTESTHSIQRPLSGYARHLDVIGTGVLAAQGSLMAKPFAPANATASGVPPRGRPV